jgi:hypothetical protein
MKRPGKELALCGTALPASASSDNPEQGYPQVFLDRFSARRIVEVKSDKE